MVITIRTVGESYAFLLIVFSIIIMRKGTKVFRDSTTFSTPENYVTIEIRNKNIKKKFSHHRSSVLHQLNATQSILNDSLAKCTPHIKSAFISPKASPFCLKKELQRDDFSSFLRVKEKRLKQNRRKNVNFQSKFRLCEQIKGKLKQITNISHQFDKACSHKPKKLKTEACELSDNYLLPTLEERKADAEPVDTGPDEKATKNWLKKLRNGRSLAQKLKKRLSNVKLHLPLKQQADNENRLDCERKPLADNSQNEGEGMINKKISLQDMYFSRQERKSAPLSNRNNTFYKLFCTHKDSEEPTLRDKVDIESQQVRRLQQFASGTQPSEFKEYDDLINIKGFIRDRQNFNVLKKMYNHVKQKYAFQFKEMNLESIKESNLLALVYYLQNQSSMTELEKKNWKAKMKFVE